MIRRLVALAALVCVVALAGAGQARADIVTCGGFVKASPGLTQAFGADAVKALDYSLVKIHLYTADGLLKYSTECAPNGYYFIPVYDKGAFALQIEGPSGWAFEPARVPFAVGDDDAHNGCSEDINFHFTGFSLSGQVLASASPSCYSAASGAAAGGPAGVALTLVAANGDVLAQTQTVAGGSFAFANVFPGAYSVSASHPVWTLTPATHQVTVGWGNAALSAPFQLNGYDVRGRVASSGAPVPDVDVFLYGAAGAKIDCPTPSAALAPAAPAGVEDGETLLCATKSAAGTGTFRFANIPCGVYRLVPYYARATTTYDVVPSNRAVNVTHAGTVDLTGDDGAFQVMGFSVGGRVVDRAGNGVEGVAIALDGVAKTTTDKDGSYKLEQVQTGRYSVRATKAHVFFHDLKGVSVTPTSGPLPDIAVTSYHVCGRVNSGEPVRARSVALAGATNGVATTTTADADGNYCFAVAPGTYTITPAVTSAEAAKSILLSPPSRTVVVADAPLLSAHFVQARVRVSGRIACMGGSGCGGAAAKVYLTSKHDADQKMIASVGAGDAFAFADVLPGAYVLAVGGSGAAGGWCWARQQFDVAVEYTDVALDVAFEQTGYALPATVSHDGVSLRVTGPNGYDSTHKLAKGANRVCLPRAGAYTARPESCYRFAQDAYTFDTAAAAPVDLTVREYRVTGTLVAGASSAAARATSLPVKVAADGAAETEVTATYERTEARAPKGDVRVYTYAFWAVADRAYTVSAPAYLSDNTDQTDVLFYPRTRAVTVPKRTAGCGASVDAFEGRAGVYRTGGVSPATAGVTITVTSLKDGAASVYTTDASGKYRAGPLYDDQQYKVSASADGYHFKEEATGEFRAVKLGRLVITVADHVTRQGLAGVLLSLTGGDGFRRNNVTDANGRFEFTQLFPGDYFLRPLLKEYEFEPRQRALAVTDAASVVEAFAATRIAYSVFGSVRALNGEPEKHVVVEALQDGVPEGAPRRYEETKTDATGAYRLRGLMPGLSYKVSVKLTGAAGAAAAAAPAAAAGADAAARIERATPAASAVTVGRADVLGHDFVAFRRTGRFDLTGTVNASAAVVATQLQQLEVVVALAATPTHAVKTQPLTRGFPFFEFSALPEDNYVVFVRPLAAGYTPSPTLPAAALAAPVITARTHAITAPHEAVALTAHTHVNPVFAAEYRAVRGADDDAERATTVIDPSNPASSLLTLVLAVAVGLAAFNRKTVARYVEQAKGVARSVGLVSGGAGAADAGAAADDGAGKRRKAKGNKK